MVGVARHPIRSSAPPMVWTGPGPQRMPSMVGVRLCRRMPKLRTMPPTADHVTAGWPRAAAISRRTGAVRGVAAAGARARRAENEIMKHTHVRGRAPAGRGGSVGGCVR